MNTDEEVNEKELILPEEVLKYISIRKSELVERLVGITPDPSRPETLNQLSKLQGTIIAYDELISKHDTAIELTKHKEG